MGLLGVVVVLGRVSGAAIVAAGASAEGFSSGEFCVGTRLSLESRVFRYFPIWVILEVVIIVRKGNGMKVSWSHWVSQ